MTDTSAPWSLHFDCDGTEDFAIIRDTNGKDIAATHLPDSRIAGRTHASGTFWLPEEEGEPVPAVLEQACLLRAAPELYSALDDLVSHHESGSGDANLFRYLLSQAKAALDSVNATQFLTLIHSSNLDEIV